MSEEKDKQSTTEKAEWAAINSLALQYVKKDTAHELANKIIADINKAYGDEVNQKAREQATKLASQLDEKNSNYRMMTILKAVDSTLLGMTNTMSSIKAAKQGMLKTDKGVIKPNSRENVRLIFEHDPHYQDLFRYNSFTEEAEYRKSTQAGFVSIDDDLIANLATDIERYYRMIPTDKAVTDGLLLAAKGHPFNPIKQRIETVQWDGQQRAANFFIDYLGADNNEYVKAVTETWLVGLVARVYRPGIKCDIMPILDGKQGIGKSTLVSLLCSPPYFEDSLRTMGADKDDLIKIHSAWVVEIGELEAMTNTSLDRTKAFISATSDNFRSPYGRIREYHPRKNMFIGTVNRSEYLHDLTGNRRFYPIHCEKSRARKPMPAPGDYNNADILQILAEAKVLFEQGHALKLPDKLERVAHDKQSKAMAADLQADLMLEYSELLVPDDWDSFSIYQRQQYWKRYREHGEYGKRVVTGTGENKTSDYILFTPDQLHKLPQFTNTELLEVVFEQNGREIARGGRNPLSAKIPMVFDNDEKWKRSDHCKLLGKRRKGYKRTVN